MANMHTLLLRMYPPNPKVGHLITLHAYQAGGRGKTLKHPQIHRPVANQS